MVAVQAQLRHLRISPKKVRLVCNAVKGMDATAATVRLSYMPQISAPIVLKLLRSAIANARHNNEIPVENLMVKNVMVNEAPALKRGKPAAFGSVHPIKKRGSHVTIVLGLKPGIAEPAAKVIGKKEKMAVDATVASLDEVPRSQKRERVGEAKQVRPKGTPRNSHAPQLPQTRNQNKSS